MIDSCPINTSVVMTARRPRGRVGEGVSRSTHEARTGLAPARYARSRSFTEYPLLTADVAATHCARCATYVFTAFGVIIHVESVLDACDVFSTWNIFLYLILHFLYLVVRLIKYYNSNFKLIS